MSGDLRKWIFQVEDAEGDIVCLGENGVGIDEDAARKSPFMGDLWDAKKEAAKRCDFWESGDRMAVRCESVSLGKVVES